MSPLIRDAQIALTNPPTVHAPMTQPLNQQQFLELKSLLDRNFDMVCRIYVEHGRRLSRLEGRLTRVEVGQEQLSRDPQRSPCPPEG